MSESRALVALVTGGGRGIGAAISKRLAADGIPVALSYNEDASAAEDTKSSIIAAGGRAMALKLSVEDRSSIEAALADIADRFGPVSVLVNNAAIAQEKPFDTITDADWDRMLAVNLRGPFALTQELLPAMLEASFGRVINITSIGGQWGGFNQVHYAASKAALINLTRSIAKIYGKDGINCNAVSPGLVGTEMSAAELSSEAGREKVRNIPVGRIATAGEVASVVSFLASEDSSYVTGQTINVNGGIYFD